MTSPVDATPAIATVMITVLTLLTGHTVWIEHIVVRYL